MFKSYRTYFLMVLVMLSVGSLGYAEDMNVEEIKSYCLDFNWAIGRRAGFAKPGTWASADPAEHVAWYKAIGANVIQTFAVSCNGYAWYKSNVIPEQPGLKHDFLTEVVQLGHAEGMKVMGYFCIAANTRWGKENPELSYGTPSAYHIPYTDEYLAYLSAAITDAVKTTGIDGFMIDWVWMPKRGSTKGKWLEAEKKLYAQLMDAPFPGEDKLTKEQILAYSRKAIDRCWKAIHKAAKDANPDCIIWLTTNHVNHPHVEGSDMYKQVDWLMGEAGRIDEILSLKSVVGANTRLITCMSDFGGGDPTETVPEGIKAGVGLYGYAKPSNDGGTINLDKIFPMQLSQLVGNAKRIAVLARAYRGMSVDSVWQDGTFVEPENPLPFRLAFKGRRGFSDTGRIEFEDDKASIHVNMPYRSGRAMLTRVAEQWPETILVRLKRTHSDRPAPTEFRVANGVMGVSIVQGEQIEVLAGKMDGGLTLQKTWGASFLNEGVPGAPVKLDAVDATTTDTFVEIAIPTVITESNPEIICFEWGRDGHV
jgi:hypothetical protein